METNRLSLLKKSLGNRDLNDLVTIWWPCVTHLECLFECLFHLVCCTTRKVMPRNNDKSKQTLTNQQWCSPYLKSAQLVTARKRSLGQGNAFTPICQSFCPKGVVYTPRADTPLGRHPPPHPETATKAGGTHPTGMCNSLTVLHSFAELF